MTLPTSRTENGIVLPLEEEELECIRVCLCNAPIPYDIAKKEIPKKLLDRIGYPTPPENIMGEGLQ
tara:strand:- start:401 stop:598 length:198 start_codon:yes stop_codon:yes gene_type:complete